MSAPKIARTLSLRPEPRRPVKLFEVFADHLRYQFNLRKILYFILSDQLAVPENRDLVADLIDLFQEVGDENNTDTPLLQIAHELEQHGDFRVVQR